MFDNLWGLDFEVFRFNWIVVIQKATDRSEQYVFANDYEGLNQWVDSHYKDLMFVGHNVKWYDKFIFQAIRNHLCLSDIKALNDWIIGGSLPWEYFYGMNTPVKDWEIAWLDTMDDGLQNRSLKTIEGYMGKTIIESSVPWDIDKPLTDYELEETIKYCKHDVESTLDLFELRRNYFEAKAYLARLHGIPEGAGMSMTNAKLVARVLGAKDAPLRSDERNYMPPRDLMDTDFPNKLKIFFEDMKDPSISDEDLFSRTANIDIGNGVDPTYGFGGIHYAIPNYFLKTKERIAE